MKLQHLNSMQQYIFTQEQKWFQKLQPFLRGKILKVGNGLGYMASFMKKTNPHLTILDITLDKDTINKEDIIVYDGKRFPVKNKEFDCSVCTLVLHHTPNPYQIISEMERTSKRLIIFEATYTNLFSKIDLIYRDIFVNMLAGQPSTIHWGSYFN